jgi:chaperone BCS1
MCIRLTKHHIVTLGMSLTLLTSLLSFFSYSIGSLTALTRFVSANLVSSATIHSSDVTYLYIMRWLAAHKISTDCRLFCVTSRKNPQSYAVRRYSSYAPYGDGNRACQEDDDDGEDEGNGEDDSLGPKLKYMPAPGKHILLLLLPRSSDFWGQLRVSFWHIYRQLLHNVSLAGAYG